MLTYAASVIGGALPCMYNTVGVLTQCPQRFLSGTYHSAVTGPEGSAHLTIEVMHRGFTWVSKHWHCSITHAHTHADTHTHTHSLTHTHARTHAHTHTHSHTHTHTHTSRI